MKFGVYEIKNVKNGKRYIGSTKKSFDIRWEQHRKNLRKNNHINNHLQHAWNKYGEESFEFSVIEEFSDSVDDEKLSRVEKNWIDELDAVDEGYNILRETDMAKIGHNHWSGEGNPMFGNGDKITGEGNPSSKLFEDDVLKIKKLLSETTKTQQEIANLFGVARPTIKDINVGRSWTDIGDYNYPVRDGSKGEYNGSTDLCESDILEIKRRIDNGEVFEEIADGFDVSDSVVISINNGSSWSYVGDYDHPIVDKSCGSDHPQAKLTEPDVKEIRNRDDQDETVKSIAKDYPVSYRTVLNVVNYNNWEKI